MKRTFLVTTTDMCGNLLRVQESPKSEAYFIKFSYTSSKVNVSKGKKINILFGEFASKPSTFSLFLVLSCATWLLAYRKIQL